MISEKGRVIAIDNDALWVETIQQTTCGSCVARKGCGQSLLSKIGVNNSFLRVLLGEKSPSEFSIGDEVNIGIPDDIVVKSSLLAYLLPILLLVLFAGVAQQITLVEPLVILAGIIGLILGGVVIKMMSFYLKNNHRYQPVLLENNSSIRNELNQNPEVVRINDNH